MKILKKIYEDPAFDIMDFEISSIISDSINPFEGGEGGAGDPPVIIDN